MFIRKMFIIMTLVLSFSFLTISNGQTKCPVNEKAKTEIRNNKMQEKYSAEKPWNDLCPVRGGDVDSKTETVKYNGKNYGFCCGGCDAKFKKNPEKYSKNLSDDGKRFIGKKS